MTIAGCFRVNKSKIIFEGFEDEVVLINLENGNYYSLEGSAAFIWNLIQSGMHVNDIRAKLEEKYNGQKEIMEKAALQFVDELVREELILAAENPGDEKISVSNDTPSNQAVAEKIIFVPPVLNRYTDMQDLLLLDPIHEVDESGWPVAPSDDSPGI
jgi:hypothetical protein